MELSSTTTTTRTSTAAAVGRIRELCDVAYPKIEEFEPTSVLDVGNRFSPPLKCQIRPDTHDTLHADPCSCPHAQAAAACQEGYTHNLHLEDQLQFHVSKPSFDTIWGEAAAYSCNMQHGAAAPSWNNHEDPELFFLLHMDIDSIGAPWPNYQGLASVDVSASSANPKTTIFDSVMQEELYLYTPASGMTSVPVPRASTYCSSLEEDDLVNMYINHTALAGEDQAEYSTAWGSFNSFFDSSTDHDEPTVRRIRGSSTVAGCQQSVESNLCVADDSCSFFHHLIDSHERLVDSPPAQNGIDASAGGAILLEDMSLYNSDVSMVGTADDQPGCSSTHRESDHDHIRQDDHDGGLELVHLLLACAEAVAWRDIPLAASLLDHLNALASHSGDSIQRVTYCFAEGLSARLASMSKELALNIQITALTVAQKKEGLLQLYQCSPYISFGIFAANQAILQAFENKTHVHIVDLGMMQDLQWPGLIRALATRVEGPPEVRISAFGTGMESLMEMNEWGRELVEFARSMKLPLEYRTMGESLDISKLNSEALCVREGETLAINSVLQLHKVVKENRGSLKGVLQRLQRLGAAAITLVEQDASHNGPFFLGRFLESLHYYSAIFDSLEATLGRHSQQRMKVERLYYAEEIRNIVACEGLERVERHERGDQWRRQMSRAGFQAVPLKFISQARMLLSLYSCDGYTLSEDKGCLVLGWKGKAIMLASAWRSSSSISIAQKTKPFN